MNPVGIFLLVAGLFLLSLLGAYVVFILLKGRATFKHEGLNLGGSAAGFVIFFWLLQRVFFTALDKIPATGYPPLEVMALGQEGQKLMTEIAFDPKKLIVSQERFNALDREDYTILSDSFKIAMAGPKAFNWSVGKLPEYNTLSATDLPFFQFMNEMTGGMLDYKANDAQYFGARVGIPTQLTVKATSQIDGVALGDNPFKNKAFYKVFVNSMQGAAKLDPGMGSPTSADIDTIQALFISSLDKVTNQTLPLKRAVYSGVYVSVYHNNSFKENAMETYMRGNDLITKAVNASAPFSRELPRLLYLNGNEQLAAYNKSVKVKGALIDGVEKDLVINYVGFAVGGDDAVYTVTLQYLSTDSAEVLRELQRYFESVRIVRPASKNKPSATPLK